MITITGKSVFGGVSIGKLSFYKRNQKVIKREHVENVESECVRFQEAKAEGIRQLKELYEKSIADVGEANAMIFEIHQMMLEDLDYIESIENIIRSQEVNAEFAVATTADNFAQMFAAMDDAYMQGRAADVKDVSERVLDILCGVSEGIKQTDEPSIIAADDLAPSETVQLDKSKVLAFATMYGSSNSHTAILARTMNIPAVIGLGESLSPQYDGKMAVIDGFTGTLYIDPDEETLSRMQKKREEDLEKKALLEQLKGKENITKSGQKINVYANIGNASDVGAVLKNDAGGIGLFRSEFLYLENETFPTEEQQFAVYKQVAENMAGKKVIIRTLDIGADKQVDYFGLDKEENPALGYRAIRICLTRPEIFKTQLRIEIAQLYQKNSATFLYVTHDQMEAMTLADILIIMKDGEIQQMGNPIAIYQNPINLFTASFLGVYDINQFTAVLAQGELFFHEQKIPWLSDDKNLSVILAVRCEHVIEVSTGGICGSIVLVEQSGEQVYYHIQYEEGVVIMKSDTSHIHQRMENIRFWIDWEYVLLFDACTQNRIYKMK